MRAHWRKAHSLRQSRHGGHPYLTETDGCSPDYRDVWYSFGALEPRHGMGEEYGRQMA